jgi:hypothetical protein
MHRVAGVYHFLPKLSLGLCAPCSSLVCILEQALLSALVGGLTAIEHLRLGEVAEILYAFQHAEEFLQLVLTKPRLTSLQFPHVFDITHQSA